MTNYERFKKIKFITQGLVTYIPFKIPGLPSHRGQFISSKVRKIDAEGTAGACYTSWLRFLVVTNIKAPKIVAEIGPGDSLGVGICALLSGADTYYPIDKYKRDLNYDNEALLSQLVQWFKARKPIPNDEAYPKAYPKLDSYEFPAHLIPDLDRNLNPARIEHIRSAILQIKNGSLEGRSGDILIRYPSEETDPIDSADFIVSAAVMEHVDDVEGVYLRSYRLLKKGGKFCHAVGLDYHGTAVQWNGHWTYSDLVWRIIRGRTMYLINRWPSSWHVNYLKRLGFKINKELTYKVPNTLSRKDLATRFKEITDEDLETKCLVVVGEK